MAVTTATTTDVAAVLGGILDDALATDCRVYYYVADKFRPPGVVIGLPDIDYTDSGSGFCFARWEFPLTIVLSRSNDKDAQEALASLTSRVAVALNDAEPAEVFSIEPLDARPATATVAGQDLPAYTMRVAVRA